MIVTRNGIDFSTATKVTPTKTGPYRPDNLDAKISMTEGMSLFELIDYHEYCERVHDELLEEQQTLANSFTSEAGDGVAHKSSADIGDLDFLQFKSRANAVRKTARTATPGMLIQTMLGLNTSAIEIIDGLEAEIRATSDQLELLEDGILSLHPSNSGEANAKLGFLCSVLLNGRELDPDQIAFILAECLEKRA